MWLVIGCGNELRTDDGFGITVAQRLQARVDPALVAVIPVRQLTPEWIEPITHACGVIFVDTSAELPPGRIQCLALTEPTPNDNPVFTHHCTPQLLLQAARALYGHAPQGWLYTVGGGSFALGETLSPPVEAAIPHVITLLLERLGTSDSLKGQSPGHRA